MPKLKRAGNLNVSLDELSQEINLKDYLGRKPTESEKTLFSELAIDIITNRTLDGQTVNGGKFVRYSKEYAEKKGVTRDSVDLFLDGGMLDGLGRRTSREKSSTVFIQLKKGLETKKGYNHQEGDTLPKREWFGITDEEARQIADEIKEDETAPRLTLADLRRAASIIGIEQVE